MAAAFELQLPDCNFPQVLPGISTLQLMIKVLVVIGDVCSGQ